MKCEVSISVDIFLNCWNLLLIGKGIECKEMFKICDGNFNTIKTIYVKISLIALMKYRNPM